MSTEITVEVDRTEAVVKFGQRAPKHVHTDHFEYDTLDSIEFTTKQVRTGWDEIGATF